ncbi:MAG: LysR family transcriptional regulator [Clostridiaceae bacterium]|nr:LysR family transcriptional regulator [Clostridiaceae bacterium]
MNLLHLKYALEVERTGSITKAAENLFMGQPNLSRVIKDLEDAADIKIFSRTSKGIIPTENGRIFLDKAREIVHQSQELEGMFKNGKNSRQVFNVVGQSSYSLIYAFNRTVELLSAEGNYDCFLEECHAGEVLERVLHDDSHIGVMRVNSADLETLQSAFWEKNIRCSIIGSFGYLLIMCSDHPLAKEKKICPAMLDEFPTLTTGGRKQWAGSGRTVAYRSFEACLGGLRTIRKGYIISRPIPKELLEKDGLVMKPYEAVIEETSDLLVYRSDHKLYDAESIFAEEFRHAYWDKNGSLL